MRFRKIKFFKPAHSLPYDYESTPLFEIQKARCLICKERFSESRKVIWARLSSGQVIWWHGRMTANSETACKYKSENLNYLKYMEKDKLRSKEYYARRKKV